MAKSIWKPGVILTRQEKKVLRSKLPHPNRGRALYRWKVENAALGRKILASGNDKLIEAVFS